MLRLCYIIIVSLPFILAYLIKAAYIKHHDDRYTEADRYRIAKQAVSIMQHNGFIHTDITVTRWPGNSGSGNGCESGSDLSDIVLCFQKQ